MGKGISWKDIEAELLKGEEFRKEYELLKEGENMDCEYRINGFCDIFDIECDNPQENNPDNYNIEEGFPCICGHFQPKV